MIAPRRATRTCEPLLAADCDLYDRQAKSRAFAARCGMCFADLWASPEPPPDRPAAALALWVVGGRG